MIEDLESDLTGSPIDASNADDVALDEVENSDEAITVESKSINEMKPDIKEEKNTKSYKETMNIDIENMNTIEKIHKVYTKRWRTIYEFIQQVFFMKLTSFRMIL